MGGSAIFTRARGIVCRSQIKQFPPRPGMVATITLSYMMLYAPHTISVESKLRAGSRTGAIAPHNVGFTT